MTINRNLRSLLAGLILFLASFQFAVAQTATISGVIRDASQRPLFGATVAVFGEPIGITTGDDGRYKLAVPANRPIKIIFSYTGLSADTLNMQLRADETKVINKSLEGKIYEMKDVVIEERSIRMMNVTPINPKVISVLPTPNQSVEDILKTPLTNPMNQ